MPRLPNLLPDPTAEPLVLARWFAVLFGLGVVAACGLGWGVRGTLAAAIGAVVSVANVFVLERLGARAVKEAAVVENAFAAGSRLHVALGIKTLILLALVVLLANVGPAGRALTPFTLGLLVTVFALVAGGLLARPAPEN